MGNVFGRSSPWPGLFESPGLLLCQLMILVVICRGVTTFFMDKGHRHFLLYFLVTPLCFLSLTLFSYWGVRSGVYIERSFVNLLPFFLIVLVRGLEVVRPRRPKMVANRVVLIGAAAFAAVVLSAYFVNSDEWTVYKPNPDWEGLGTYFDEEFERTRVRPIAFVVELSPLKYYTDSPILIHAARMRPPDSFKGHFYFISNRYWNEVTKQMLGVALWKRGLTQQGYSIADHLQFKGLDIYKISR
jgi:hypothetical protein